MMTATTASSTTATRFNGWCDTLPTIVAFTARQWCPHCVVLEPEWKKLREVDGIHVHFLQCDASDDPIQELNNCRLTDAFNIQSFPTILIFSPDTKKFVVYSGARQADRMVHFARDKLQVTTKSAEYPVSKKELLLTKKHKCFSAAV